MDEPPVPVGPPAAPSYTPPGNDEDRPFRLLDGQTVMVGRTQQQAIQILRVAMDFLAMGTTRGISVVEVDAEGHTRESLVTLDGSGLIELAAALIKQNKTASKLGATWDGNAPISNRSISEH